MNHILEVMLAVVLSISSLFGGANIADVPAATEVVASESVILDEVPLLTEDEAYVWAYEVLDGYGLELAEGIELKITDANNCGSVLSTYGTGGGCFTPLTGELMISPTAVGTESGEIILLHEYAHSIGYMNECAAEVYSHTLMETGLWAYPECAKYMK